MVLSRRARSLSAPCLPSLELSVLTPWADRHGSTDQVICSLRDGVVRDRVSQETYGTGEPTTHEKLYRPGDLKGVAESHKAWDVRTEQPRQTDSS